MLNGLLTAEQQKAVRDGGAVPIDLDGTPCVLIHQDVYSRVKSLLFDEENSTEVYRVALEAWDADDENPEQYLEYLDR